MKHSLFLQMLTFALTRIVFNTLHRMVYPYLAVFARGLGVSVTQMSLALTARAVSGALGPFLASITDRRGRKVGLIGGVVLFVLGASLVIIKPVFGVFVAALILSTVGYLIFIPSMQAYLGDRIPYQRRGLALAITELGWSLSFILGVPLVGLMISRWGWASPFQLLAGLGLLALLALAVMIPRDPPASASQNGWLGNFREVLFSTPALLGLAMSMSFTMANEVVNLIFGVWLDGAFQVKITALGGIAVGIGLAEFGGESLVGGLADRLGKARAVKIGLLLNCLAALLLVLFGNQLWGALAGLLLFFCSFEFTVVSSFPMMTEVLPSARATLMAANIALMSCGRALGAFLAPRIYNLGDWLPGAPAIALNVVAAIAFNVLALAALARLKSALQDKI